MRREPDRRTIQAYNKGMLRAIEITDFPLLAKALPEDIEDGIASPVVRGGSVKWQIGRDKLGRDADYVRAFTQTSERFFPPPGGVSPLLGKNQADSLLAPSLLLLKADM